jgi:hypothetical protein
VAGPFVEIVRGVAVEENARGIAAQRMAGKAKRWAPRRVVDLLRMFGGFPGQENAAIAENLHRLVTDVEMSGVWAALKEYPEDHTFVAMAAALGAVNGAGTYTLTSREGERRAQDVLDAIGALFRAINAAPHVAEKFPSDLLRITDRIGDDARKAIENAREPQFGKGDRSFNKSARDARPRGAQDDRAFMVMLWNTLPERGVSEEEDAALIATFGRVLLDRDLSEKTIKRARKKSRRASRAEG